MAQMLTPYSDNSLQSTSMDISKDNYKDFEWAFGLNRICLNLIGLWPNEIYENVEIFKSDFRHLRIPCMLFVIMIGLIMPQLYALTHVYRDLQLVTDNVTISYCAITSFIKLFFLWKSRRAFKPILQSALLDWRSSRSHLWEYQIMEKQARRARIFTISGYVIMSFSFVGFMFFPFFGISIRIINNTTDPGYEQRFLPLQSRYPFEAKRSPNFEIAYFSQVVMCCCAGACFSIPDYFFGALVFHASAQCEILRTRVRELLCSPKLAVNLDKTWTEMGFFKFKLGQLVHRHTHLIRFVYIIEDSFNLIILAQVLCLMVIICCLGFGVLKSIGNKDESSPIVQIATLAGTLLNLMIHMLVYCIAAEILAQHSEEISDAAYCCSWYLLPAAHSREIIPIMIRAQFPLQLSAGKFFCLSLNSFLSIIKSSFGYVSVLLAVSS